MPAAMLIKATLAGAQLNGIPVAGRSGASPALITAHLRPRSPLRGRYFQPVNLRKGLPIIREVRRVRYSAARMISVVTLVTASLLIGCGIAGLCVAGQGSSSSAGSNETGNGSMISNFCPDRALAWVTYRSPSRRNSTTRASSARMPM